MFRQLLRMPLSLKSSRSLCIDASKQAKIEELIKKSQQMNNNISTTQRFVSWLSKNRQQLMNTVMVSLVTLLHHHYYLNHLLLSIGFLCISIFFSYIQCSNSLQ